MKLQLLLACILLLIAVAPMPYGYYEFLRISITIIASINTYNLYNNNNNKIFLYTFISIIILYNPIIPVHLSKTIWTPINLITTAFFGLFALFHKNKDVEGDSSQL